MSLAAWLATFSHSASDGRHIGGPSGDGATAPSTRFPMTSCTCSYLGQGAVGAEIGWIDDKGLQVGMAVQAEQPDRSLVAVEQDERDGISPGGPDGEGLLDGSGELAER